MLVLPRMEMVFTIILARRVVDLGTRRGVAGNHRRTCIAVRAITEGLGMVAVTLARVCEGDFRWGWGGQAQRPHHRCEVRLGDRADSTCNGRDPGRCGEIPRTDPLDSVHCALGQALRNAWYGTVRIDPNWSQL